MTSNGISQDKINSRIAAGAALTIAAGQASSSLDKFAVWFLTAFAAGLALILSHLKDVSEFIPVATVASAANYFLVAAVICVAQRYVAMVIATGAASEKEGRELFPKLQPMDLPEFIAQMLQGLPWVVRILARGQFDALTRGDYAASGKLSVRMTIVHGGLVSAEVIVLLIALSKIVKEIPA